MPWRDVRDTWAGFLGPAAEVLTRDEAVARGWFGTALPGMLPRIGDVVVASTGDHGVFSSRDFSYETTLVGLHGSLDVRRDAHPDARVLTRVTRARCGRRRRRRTTR